MKTPVLFKIKCLKNQVAACLREIAKGVKKYVLDLCDLEQQLEKLEAIMENQIEFKTQGAVVNATINGHWVAKIVDKSGKHWSTNEFIAEFKVETIKDCFGDNHSFTSIEDAKKFILNVGLDLQFRKVSAFWETQKMKMENKKSRIVNASECGKGSRKVF